MENKLESAIEESLPSDETAESSTVTTGDPEAPAETPAQKVEPEKEPPFHEHPRWKEMQQEKEYYKNIAMQALEAAKRPVHVQSTQPQQEVDPYDGMTPEERVAYEKLDNRTKKLIKQEIEEARKPLLDELEKLKIEAGMSKYERFIAKYPDIDPTSQEGNMVAQLINSGKTPDEAVAIVRFPAMQKKLAELEKEQKNKKLQQKLETPPEPSQSIPAISGIKTKEKQDFRSILAENMKKEGF